MSVILPTYQRRELVMAAIASVLAQTYQDLELIVVDDGSTDGTCEALASQEDRVHYVWQQNRGPSAARNTALGLARGEIVAPLDSDDLWLPHHLETALLALDRHPEAVLATTCPGRRAIDPQRIEAAKLVEPYPRLFFETFVGWIHCCVIRRSALEAIGGFDERIQAGEHHDIFMRLGLQGPFVTVQRRTAVRRAAPNSLHERSRENGDYVTGFGVTADTVLRSLELTGRRPELIPAARARVEFGRALSALHVGDDATTRAALRRACELFPDYSSAPDWVDARIRFTTGRGARAELMRKLAAAAMLWPRPDADTPMYLRGHALALAVRTGRATAAAELLRGWPLHATPAFARRVAPQLRRRAREWIYGQRHRVRR